MCSCGNRLAKGGVQPVETCIEFDAQPVQNLGEECPSGSRCNDVEYFLVREPVLA
jgi:hypothetical protein